MAHVREGTVGILPAGALGVALFFYLTRKLTRCDGSAIFLERSGSQSAAALREHPLKIEHGGRVHSLAPQGIMGGSLNEAFNAGTLPEVLVLCPNPDQLTGIIGEFINLLEAIHEAGELENLQVPIVVLSSNGIYYQRQRQFMIERLEESTLLGRLPDLWPELMPRIVGRLLRGVTIQTGTRDGVGAQAVYHPGPPGITRIAGGDAWARQRACDLLAGHGGWFELADRSSATRLEFDKAMVNLISNLLGQLSAIQMDGTFTPLRVSEIVTGQNEPRIRELIERVVEIGRAVKAYDATESIETIMVRVIKTTRQQDEHVPSSLQWVDLRLRQRKLAPELTPTEQWLLDPLIRYAHAAELHEAANFFERLRQELLVRLRAAAARQGERPSAPEA